MSGKRYTEEFKAEAVKQVLERGHPTAGVAARLGINKHSLYEWVKQAKVLATPAATATSQQSQEIRRLQAEVRRLTEERDILKKAAAYFAKG